MGDLCFLFVVLVQFSSAAVDYSSKLVFDPVFYVNAHSDIKGLRSPHAAKHHWLSRGIHEGRQGSGNFHSKQYLKRYSDLTNAFAHDYHHAVEHYLTYGQKEHRLGYVEGGFEGRWTISNGKDLFISASATMAGAVDSLVWNHKEFINAWDHGRELQMAINAPPNGECFNPTEAGGIDDGTGSSTKSHLQGVYASGRNLRTSVLPAFWLRVGDHEAGAAGTNCGKGSPALNTQNTYPYVLSKSVEIGCAGLDHCVKFLSGFDIKGHWPPYEFLNFEAPTGYMAGDFTVKMRYDPHANRLVPDGSAHLPAVMLTPDNKFAVGVYAPPGQDSDRHMYYAMWNFGGNFAQKTNKWNVVFMKNKYPDGSSHHLTYTAYICVGDAQMVVNCLHKVHITYPHV